MNIVLYEPDIPQNTGNIIRLCACTGSSLFLVGKLGFHLTDKHMRRAGLDYWQEVNIFKYENLQTLFKDFTGRKFYYLSTKASKNYAEIRFNLDDFLIFGSETKGLPEDLIFNNPENALTIPMAPGHRSLNLANSVSVVLYEALRQNRFTFSLPCS